MGGLRNQRGHALPLQRVRRCRRWNRERVELPVLPLSCSRTARAAYADFVADSKPGWICVFEPDVICVCNSDAVQHANT